MIDNSCLLYEHTDLFCGIPSNEEKILIVLIGSVCCHSKGSSQRLLTSSW